MPDSSASKNIENQLIKITRQFIDELGAERVQLSVSLDAVLEKDLGLGSLEKAELQYRIEKTFGVRLPEHLLVQAKTLRDFVIPIQEAKPQKHVLLETLDTKLAAPQQTLAQNTSQAKTLIEVLQLYVDADPQRPHIYLQDDEGKEHIIRYGDLLEQSKAVAKGLLQRGIKQGETVAIMLPTCADFFSSFFGTLLAGGVPVPIYPPFRADQIVEYAKREALILSNAEVRVLITFEQAEGLSKILKSFIPSLIDVTTIKSLQTSTSPLPSISLTTNDAAFIQYTSGSTGNPKGVLLTHANLLANIRAYGEAIQVKPGDVVVTWLPLYHDMGLIGTWLGSLYYGVPVVIMSPLLFLNRPERWLWTIHYHRATISAGPNFAYELCVGKIDDSALEGLDLSSWRLAFNGAEAIYPKTLKSFTQRFIRYGFKPESFFPVYGLAESSVALTFPPMGRVPRIDKIAREPFEKQRQAIPYDADEKYILEFVSCGKVLLAHEIRIVDDAGNVLLERQVGNLQFRGPSSMQGYYRNPKATAEIYHDGWWDTGDLAYLVEDEVYIAGRKKDVIIKAGRNIYPPEIEDAVNQVPGVRRGCAVAFGVKDAERGTEKFIIMAETQEQETKAREKIISQIIEVVTAQLGLPPDQVVLVPPRTIPKTSSGKLRRSSAMQMYVEGKLEKRGWPIWLQMIRLFFTGKYKNLQKGLQKLFKLVYSGYVYSATFITVIPVWLSMFVLPRRTASIVGRCWARSILWLIGCPCVVKGVKQQSSSAVIYVANHSSYIDSIALMAALPSDCAFVGKKELLKAPIIGTFMRKLGYISIDRTDLMQSLSDTQAIQNCLREGRSIVIFPEGTFTYATGLRPFKLGAFKVAVETNTPICPVALKGTRQVLRSGSNLFRPGIIHVYISDPLQPESQEWSEVIRLRNLVRNEIAKHSREPTLDLIKAGLEII
jgi:fatty-acyl-CoA synthase